MTTHLVLFKPRADLAAHEQRALIAAFKRAMLDIPSVRGVRVGRRIVDGPAYDQRMPDGAEYLVAIDFDDRRALEAYLAHEAHADLGMQFRAALARAMVGDYESIAFDDLEVTRPPAPTA